MLVRLSLTLAPSVSKKWIAGSTKGEKEVGSMMVFLGHTGLSKGLGNGVPLEEDIFLQTVLV